MDSEGFLTCSIVGAYLQDVEINMTHEDFWDGLTYVLGKMNEDVMKRRKMKEKRK